MAGAAVDRSGEAFERWRLLAEKAAGVPLASLATTTAGGIRVEPLYPPHPRAARQPWRAGDGWAVSQRLDHPAADDAFALADLAGGATALTLVTADSPYARGVGLPPDRDSIAAALEGVELDLISMRLDGSGAAAIEALAEIAAERRLRSAGLQVDGGCDPIGAAACTGAVPDLGALPAAIEAARRGGFSGCPLLADGRPYHESGAGEAEELAAVVATAVAYLRVLAGSGMTLDAARDAIAMLLPVDAEFIPGIAKLRALRRLWALVCDASGLDPRPLRLHAETSWRCMTRHDPHTNALRSAIGAAAAGLGGADVVTVLPMTLAAGLPDAEARRLARNTGRVLIDEAHLCRVDDAGGGSGAIEAITDALCEDAWALFQQIEAAGGLPAAGDRLRARIAATASRRADEIATLRRGIVGSSLYPSAETTIPTLGGLSHRTPSTSDPRRRDAEPFEALRDRGEAAGRPRVFLAALGAPEAYGARAAFAANLLAAAGLAATAPEPVEDLTARFRASGARVACLCGSDEAYGTDAEAAIAVLRQAGATFVLLAGSDETWRGRGADALVHRGCPALQVLDDALRHATAPLD